MYKRQGGSFDPIHHGHLRAALESYQRLGLKNITFVPCYRHALAKPLQATAVQRLHMLKLAIAGQSFFSLNECELQQQSTSFMRDTLIQVVNENQQQKFALIFGVDTFVDLQKWKQWQELLNYASIIVLHRPGYSIAKDHRMYTYLNQHRCTDEKAFLSQCNNSILLLSTPLLEISSSYIRQQIKARQNPCYLLPQAVIDYIVQEKIYD